MSKRTRSLTDGQRRAGLLFVTPTMLIFTAFVFIPLLISFVFSFLKFDMMFGNMEFRALGNYVRLFTDKRFWNAMGNTLYYTLGTVPLQILLALLTAIALKKNSKINTFMKSVFFLPAIVSMTVISIIWSFLLDKDIGTFMYWLQGLGLEPIALLKSPVWAMPTIILVSVWKGFGFNMVILIAGLQGIPESYYEAANIDGANALQKFWRITVPMLMPTLSFTVVNSIISSFKVFDQIYIMTKGGPLFKTQTVVQLIYSTAFESFDMGYASTIAVILFVVTFLVSLFTFRRMQRGEDDLT